MEGKDHLSPAYSRSGLALRVLAAALVVVASIAVSELALDSRSGPSAMSGARVLDYELDSDLIGETLPVTVVVPRGARDGRRSLLVFLHGRGEDEGSYLDEEMFEALARQGGRAPVVAFPRGGPESYWHDRADDGAWGSYILEELLPALVERFEIEPERIAIGGISMGGFGAFDIARQDPFELRGGRLAEFCAVGGHSPAVWQNASDTARGAFDDASDFNRHDLIAQLGAEGGSPLENRRYWLDVGDDDPFREADEALGESLEAGGAKGKPYIGRGGHESSYWDSNWRRYMHFYARALKRCQQAESRQGDRDDSKRSD
jgi:S-formylglutathione hydrolase FrmB